MNEIQSLTSLAAKTVSQSIGLYEDEVCTELPREIWEHLMWHLHPDDLHRLTSLFKKKGIGCNEVWKKHVKGPFRTRYEESCKSEYGVLLVGHIRRPKYHEAYIIRKVSEILFEQKHQVERRSEELNTQTSKKIACTPRLQRKLMPYSSFLTSLELSSTYCKVLVYDKDTAKSLVGNVLSLKIDFVYQKYYQDVVNLVKLLRCEGNLQYVSFHEMRLECFTDLLLMCSIQYPDSDDSHNFPAGFRQKRQCHHISGKSNCKKVCYGIDSDVNVSCNSVMMKSCAVSSIGDEKNNSENCNTSEQSEQLLVGTYSDSLKRKQNERTDFDETVFAAGDTYLNQSSRDSHPEQTGFDHFDEAVFAQGDEHSHQSSMDRHPEQTGFDLFDEAFVSEFVKNSNQSGTEKHDEHTSFSYSDDSEAEENSNQILTMEHAENEGFDLFDEAVISGDNAVAKQPTISFESMHTKQVKIGKADLVLEPSCSRKFNTFLDKYNQVDNLQSNSVQMSKTASWCMTGSPRFQQKSNRIDGESQNTMEIEEIDHSSTAKHFFLSNIESLHMNFSFTGTAAQPTPMYSSLATLMKILPQWKSLQRLGLEFFGHGNYGTVDLSPVVELIQKKRLTHVMINTNTMEETFIAKIIHTLLLDYGEYQGHGKPMGMLKLEDHSGKQISLPALSGCDGKIQGVSWLILQDMGFQDLSGLHQLIDADIALRHLNLTGCHLHGDDLVKIFKSLSSTCVIEELVIDYNHLKSNTIDVYAELIIFLRKVKHLKKLHMKYCWIQKELFANPEFIKAIQNHCCLEELALSLNFLGSAATDFLINIFTNSTFPRLQRLDISDNRIEGKHLFSAAARLKQAVELYPVKDRYLLERLDVSLSLVMVKELDHLRKEFKDIVSEFVVTSKSNFNADFIAQM
ncbi:hypothetical protein ACJMK2_030963 [Sinanodonta woodiana]|uniref:Uncharacterized protein n=1 Tax=Sinanodonta woodiana TaxID=1069815 RepID=A0ABD3WXC4_SINWO